MFLLLIKIRLLSARNAALEALRQQPLLTIGLGLLGVGLFVGVYMAFLLFFRYAEALGVFHEVVFQVVYFLFLFLLAGAVPFVASTLLHSSDYALLFNAPLPPRAVIAAKLLDATLTNSVQFSVLGLPALAACAVMLGISDAGWLLLPLLVALFVLLPALLTALGLLILLGLLGIRRLRAAIALLNALMALIVCATVVLEAAHLPRPGPLGVAIPPTPSPAAHAAPSQFFAVALLALANAGGHHVMEGLMLTALIAAAVAALFAACVGLGGHLLSAASIAEEETGRIHGRARGWRGWRAIFGMPVAALILKDFKYMSRDSILLSQLAMPLILFLVPVLLSTQNSTLKLRDELYPSAAMMTGIILFMQTSILSLTCIGLEGRSFWILMTAPNAASRILWAKFVMATAFTGGIGILLTLIAGFGFGASGKVMLMQSGLILCSAAALCGMGVGISAALPRFVYENPAHRVSGWALILGFFATIAYVVATALLVFMAWYFTVSPQYRDYTHFVWATCGLIYVCMTLTAIGVPLFIGAKRLQYYQWEN